jgi:predicted methyltransferase
MLRGLLPLSRSRLRGRRREANVKAKIKARGWRVEAKAQVEDKGKVEIKK